MIKTITTLLILATLSIQVNAFAADKEEKIIPSNQNIKVKGINLIGGPIHSQDKLEKFLIKEQNNGWVYDYHVDIDDAESGYITKLFVFKRATKAKIIN